MNHYFDALRYLAGQLQKANKEVVITAMTISKVMANIEGMVSNALFSSLGSGTIVVPEQNILLYRRHLVLIMESLIITQPNLRYEIKAQPYAEGTCILNLFIWCE